MIIIGITGTIGAGKGTIVECLEQLGFVHFSVRNFITQEILRRNLTVNRDNMVIVANDLRANNSPSYIVEELFEQAKLSGKNCVIESIRTPGEAIALKQKGNFFLFAVDADSNLRYERILLRNSETDNVSFETFVENEKREMKSIDPNKQNISECIKMADFVFINNGTIQDLHTKIKKVINDFSE